MNKEFIPYTEALALKELGFDEPCLKVGNPNGCIMWKWIEVDGDPPTVNINDIIEVSYDNKWIQIPTFSQAFRWFREKYKLSGTPQYFTGGYYCYTINDMKDTKESNRLFTEFETYEEAELACLRKLIEIVEQKIED